MRLCVFFMLLLGGVTAFAQNYPKVDVFGGYSYLNFDVPQTDVTNSTRLNTNGWEAAVAIGFLHHFGAVADISGHYKGDCGGLGLNCSEYSFLFGPRVTFGSEKKRVTGFVHALVGIDRLSAGASGISASNNSLGAAAGGGLDYWITRRVGIRLAQGDYLFTRHLHDLDVPVQHNFRVSAGIVFSFGGSSNGNAHAAAVPPPTIVSRPATSRTTMSIPSLGILVSPPREGAEGAEIVGIAPGSVAELAMLHVGDVIDAIDGKPVKTPMELAAQLANRTPGSQIQLGYLYHSSGIGVYQVDTVVVLGANR